MINKKINKEEYKKAYNTHEHCCMYCKFYLMLQRGDGLDRCYITRKLIENKDAIKTNSCELFKEQKY